MNFVKAIECAMDNQSVYIFDSDGNKIQMAIKNKKIMLIDIYNHIDKTKEAWKFLSSDDWCALASQLRHENVFLHIIIGYLRIFFDDHNVFYRKYDPERKRYTMLYNSSIVEYGTVIPARISKEDQSENDWCLEIENN